MRNLYKASKLSAATLILVLAVACGGDWLTGLRIGFAASGPLVDSLEKSGKISADLAGELRIDFPDAVDVGVGLAKTLSAIPKEALDRRARQFKAWQNGEKVWLAIVNRGHFKLNDRTQNIVNIANSIFAAAIEGYGGSSAGGAGGEITVGLGKGRSVTARAETAPPKSDKEIERDLKAKLDQLREAMKP